MKNTSKYFTFNFTISDTTSEAIILPAKFEELFSTMTTTTNNRNSIQELCCFCDEYAELKDEDKNKLQEIIESDLITEKLNTFHDLRILVWTLGDFEVIERAKNVTELGKQLLFHEIHNNSKNAEYDFKKAGLEFCKQTRGKFHKNGNYYYISKIRKN